MEALTALLQPQGIKVVTTGVDELGAYLQARYGSLDPAVIDRAWRERLERIATARVLLLGVPMDLGAGFERGAFKGPLGIRSQLLKVSGLYARMEDLGVVDLGDVRVNPSLLSDGYLSERVKRAVRQARGQDPWDDKLPVAPLSILKRVLRVVEKLNPAARVLLLGGDHSLSMVSAVHLARRQDNENRSLGVVHFDAHTDLLRERDGLRCSFATWAHHANDALGRGGRLQQLGIRISGLTREEWERDLSVRQFWSEEILQRGTDEVVAEVVANLQRVGVRRVYVSNDVDGTDPRWGAATGTMVRGGMTPDFVASVVRRLGEVFAVVGADVTELAPPLKWHVPGEPARSTRTAAHYALAQLDALLAGETRFRDELPPPEPATEEEVWALPPLA